MQHPFKRFFGILMILTSLIACPKADYPGDDNPTGQDDPSTVWGDLRTHADQAGLFLGAAVNPDYFSETAYSNTLKNEFNMLVAENAMKMDATQPAEGSFNFTKADSIVSFAQSNGMAIRGHALLWHSQVPAWVSAKASGGNAVLLSVLQSHIDGVVTRFKGIIDSWDVVNEVVKDDGTGLRNRGDNSSLWAASLTDDTLIKEAFYRAHAVDPTAKLFINDYSNETLGAAKADKLYSLVAGWVVAGVPVDGVGFQLHLMEKYTPDYAKIRANIDRYIALGLEVQFTEIDIRIEKPVTQAKLDNQAAIYAALVRIALDYRGTPGVSAFVTWGVTDLHSWVPGFFTGYDAGLLFDALYSPKPAYYAVLGEL